MRLRFHNEVEVQIPPAVNVAWPCDCPECVEAKKRAQKKKELLKELPKELPKKYETNGIVVLESEPQFRTVFTSSNKGLQRLAFPYILHVVAYKLVNGKYIYPGIYGSGLRVFFRNDKMETYKDLVAPAALDYARYGLVCTPHGYDNSGFEDLREMCNFVISMWWNMEHQLQYAKNDWPKMNLKEALEYNWGVKNETLLSFPNALVKTAASGYGGDRSFYPDVDSSSLIDEPWQSKQSKQLVLKEC